MGTARVYGNLLSELTTTTGIYQDCFRSRFSFHFFTRMSIETASNSSESSGIDVCSGRNLCDFECLDEAELVCNDPNNFQTFLSHLSDSVFMFRIRFAPSNCKSLSQNWIGSKSNTVLATIQVDEMDRFSCSRSCLSPSGRVSEESCSRMQNTLLEFSSLKYLWIRRCIRLSIKDRVCTAALRSALLYGCKTLPVIAHDLSRFSTFNQRYPCRIEPVWRDRRLSNPEVRRKSRVLISILKNKHQMWIG